jgi:predicted secreted acid phosphatase
MNKFNNIPGLSHLRVMSAHNNLHGVLFNATSAEYYALTIQCYQLARHALQERLAQGTFLNPAVVMDLDETVLDNSPYQAWLIASGHNFHEPSSWDPWCAAGEADAVPGAVEFVRFARAQEVEVLFITSRSDSTREGTARNLYLLGLLTNEEYEAERKARSAEHALETRLFMKGMPSLKVVRPSGEVTYDLKNKFQQRRFCEEIRSYEVVLSIGDNLADWAEYYGSIFDKDGNATKGSHPTVASRRQSAIQDSKLFGRDFVLLPNVTYGGWVRAFEVQSLGASDELAHTAGQVREALKEPQDEFRYAEGVAKAAAPKLSSTNLRIWNGP